MGSWQIPICSRCFGILLGLPIGLWIGYSHLFSSRWCGFIFLMPLFIDSGTQELGLRKSNNYLRLITGFWGGIGIGIFFLLWLLRDIHILFTKLL